MYENITINIKITRSIGLVKMTVFTTCVGSGPAQTKYISKKYLKVQGSFALNSST